MRVSDGRTAPPGGQLVPGEGVGGGGRRAPPSPIATY